MAEGKLRNPPEGPFVGQKGRVVIPQIAVGASSTGSGTFLFTGVEPGANVVVNPLAPVGNVGAPQVWVPSADHIALMYATGGAALTIATQSFDVTVLDF